MLERVKNARRVAAGEGEEVTFVNAAWAKELRWWRFTGGLALTSARSAGPRARSTPRFPGTRVEYKLIADGEWLLDPLNPDKNDNGVGGENSFFTMPDYRASAFINAEGVRRLPPGLDAKADFKKWARHGPGGAAISFGDLLVNIRLEDVTSVHLGGKRTVAVYLPREYAKGGQTRYPVLYVQDGSDYIRRATPWKSPTKWSRR